MRKSFTRLFSFMLTGLLIFVAAASAMAQVIGTPPQQTITTSVDDVNVCYNESNSYKVQVSVLDFVNLDSLNLVLNYTLGDFAYVGATWLDEGTGGTPLNVSPAVASVTETVPGKLNIVWGDEAVTHHEVSPDDTPVAILELEFQVVNATAKASYSSTLTWDETVSKYYWESAAGYEAVNDLEYFGATLTATQTINPVIDTGDSDALCYGGNVTISVSSPVGTGIEYSFNGGAWQTSPDADVTAPSSNSVMVRNTDSGCISHDIDFMVGSADPLSFTADSTDARCYGENGSIVFHPVGGSMPYTYWVVPQSNFSAVINKLIANPNDATLAQYQFTSSTVLRPADTYFIAVNDKNGCAKLLNDPEDGPSTYWQTASIFPASEIDTISTSVVDVTCYSGSDGEITVEPTGGNPKVVGYTIELDGSQLDTITGSTYTFSGLDAGTYTVTIMDSLCSRDFDFTVGQPSAVTFAVWYKDVPCNVTPDGQIAVSSINGTVVDDTNFDIWSFDVYDAEGTFVGGASVGDTVVGLDPAYYSVILTDAASCTYAYSNPSGDGNTVPVMSPTEIKYTVTHEDVDCNGASTGSITLTSLSGATNYEFQLDGGAWSSDQTIYQNLADGTYVVNVRDADNTDRCEINKSVTIAEPTSVLSITLVDANQPSCPGGNDGNVSISVSGGTPFLDANDDPYYMYSVDGSPYFVGNPTFALTEGDHDISVKDMNGCEATTTETVPALSPETITATADFIKCFGDSTVIDTTITSQAYAFDSQYYTTYVNTVNEVGGDEFVPGVDEFVAGTYYVSSLSPNGCWTNVVKVVIEQNPELELLDVSIQNASCNEYWDGFISVMVTGGTPFYDHRYDYAVANNPVAFSNPGSMISWEPFFNDDVDNDSTTIIQALEGTYYVGVRDSCGNIIHSEKIDITAQASITIGDVAVTPVKCFDEANGKIDVTDAVTGGNGDYRYTLTQEEGFGPYF